MWRYTFGNSAVAPNANVKIEKLWVGERVSGSVAHEEGVIRADYAWIDGLMHDLRVEIVGALLVHIL